MLVPAVVCFSLLQFSVAQLQYGAGLFDNLFAFPKLCFCKCGLQRRSDNSWFSSRNEPTSPSQFPWLVTIRTGDEFITGSLLTDRHVITAASPLYMLPASNITVTLGSRGRCDASTGLASNIESVSVHPDFSQITLESNLAVIKLKYVVPFDNTISPVCLPKGTSDTGKVAYTASFNSTCTGRVVTLPVLSSRQCLTNGANITFVTADKGCLGPVAARGILCDDDVGAPVMTQWMSGTSFHLIGVVSSSDCSRVSTPLYTRVADHIGWIRDQIRNACQCYSKF